MTVGGVFRMVAEGFGREVQSGVETMRSLICLVCSFYTFFLFETELTPFLPTVGLVAAKTGAPQFSERRARR